MKTHVKNHPFQENEECDNAYVVLDESETKWINDRSNVCHKPMKKVMREKAEKVQKRYKKNVIVFDVDGKKRLSLQIE